MSWTLGIDFGTTNTAAAYRSDDGPSHPVRLSDQAEQMPSAVLALDTGVMVAGAAVRSARLDPSRFEASPKRRLAEREIRLGPRSWPVADLIGEVLSHVKQKAMWVAGGSQPSRLVLTYPQRWDQSRKELLAAAVERTGIDRGAVRLVSEPIAAATWYASTQPVPAGQCVAVFDFGGGTLDVAVLRANGDHPGTFTVLAADGMDPLGGELLDQRLLDWTREQLVAGGNGALVSSLEQPENLGALLTLKEQVRHAKHELAEYNSSLIPVAVGPLHTVLTITVDEFDALVGPDIEAGIELTRRVLVRSGVSPGQLHALYLTGGSSQLRLVHRKITDLLGKPPATLNDPKLVVAQGALLVPPNALEAVGRPAPGSAPPMQPVRTGPIPVPGPPTQHTGPVPQHTGPIPPAQHTGPVPRPMPQRPPTGGVPVPAYPGPGVQGRPPAGVPTGYGGQPPRPAGPMPAAMAQGPGGPPPTQRMPFPPGPPPAARPSRPKWLIPTIAAAVVAVVALVLALTLGGSSTEDDRAGTAGVTSVSTATSTTSSCAAGGCVKPQQICADGTTIAADATCSTTEATTCWDDSEAGAGQSCPALEGQAALEWLFPIPDDWNRSCSTFDEPFDGEVEVYKCSVEELPGVSMYLSRWESSDTAEREFQRRFGDPADWTLDSDTVVGQKWDYEGKDAESDTPLLAHIRLYDEAPFSMFAQVAEPDGTGAEADETWSDNQLYRSQAAIAAQGSGP